jgi:hypothetical protein
MCNVKKCGFCSAEFEDKTSNGNKICCSKKCVNALWYQTHKHRSKKKSQEYRLSLNRQLITKKKQQEGRPLCRDCGKILNRSNRSGYCSICRYDHNIWYKNNKERRKQYELDYYANPLNREKLNTRLRNRLSNDLNFKLRSALRCRLKEAIKNNQKSGSAVRDLGCSIEELKTHLESKFLPGMTWDNWSRDGWHIDHIVPLASFDLSDPEQLKKACHYTNLQPLWAKDNIRKGDKGSSHV